MSEVGSTRSVLRTSEALHHQRLLHTHQLDMAEGRGMMTRSRTAAAQETATNVTTPRGRGRGIRQTPPSTVGETPPRAVGETECEFSDRMRRIYDRVDYQAQWVRDELDDRDRRLLDVEGSLFNRLSAAERRGEERYRETLSELEQHSYQRDCRLHDVEGAVSHRLEVVEHREKELNHKMEQVRSDVAQNSQQLSNQVAALQEMVMALIDANTQRHEKQRGREDDCDQASKVPSQRN